MMTVWKFVLPIDDRVVLSMPIGAQVLHVYAQDAVGPCLWALVDTDAPTTEDRTFRVVGTGHPIDDPLIRYVGTFHIQVNMDYVFHVFEVLPNAVDSALVAVQDFNDGQDGPEVELHAEVTALPLTPKCECGAPLDDEGVCSKLPIREDE